MSMLCNAIHEIAQARKKSAATDSCAALEPAHLTLQCLKMDEGRILLQVQDGSGMMIMDSNSESIDSEASEATERSWDPIIFRYTGRKNHAFGAESNTLDDPF